MKYYVPHLPFIVTIMFFFSQDSQTISNKLITYPGNSSNARLVNFCTLYAKYFIYTHKIKGNNNFEFLGYLTSLKHVLMIEEKICITKHQEKSFAPLNIVLDSL